MNPLVSSVVVGNNADLIAEVARLYLPAGATVADVTFGRGVFWKKVKGVYDLHESDLGHVDPLRRHDFRKLPYPDATFDVAVFDPPYIHHAGRSSLHEKRYRGHATTKMLYHRQIMALYVEGMRECGRIIKEGGTVWVKCKDEVESSFQRWSHIEVANIGTGLGLYCRDLFILIPQSRRIERAGNAQHHARKNHSYLWVLEKMTEKRFKQWNSFAVKDTFLLAAAMIG